MNRTQRKAAYIAAVAALSIAFVYGWLSPDQLDAYLDAASRAAGIAAGLLALANLSPDK